MDFWEKLSTPTSSTNDCDIMVEPSDTEVTSAVEPSETATRTGQKTLTISTVSDLPSISVSKSRNVSVSHSHSVLGGNPPLVIRLKKSRSNGIFSSTV